MRVNPDPVRIATEGALWGAIKANGFLPETVIVSDDAGQFLVGCHALCRVGGGVAIPAPHRPGRADFPHLTRVASGKVSKAITSRVAGGDSPPFSKRVFRGLGLFGWQGLDRRWSWP